jgi:hypothetical protein
MKATNSEWFSINNFFRSLYGHRQVSQCHKNYVKIDAIYNVKYAYISLHECTWNLESHFPPTQGINTQKSLQPTLNTNNLTFLESRRPSSFPISSQRKNIHLKSVVWHPVIKREYGKLIPSVHIRFALPFPHCVHNFVFANNLFPFLLPVENSIRDISDFEGRDYKRFLWQGTELAFLFRRR